jgi:hypothetical protein
LAKKYLELNEEVELNAIGNAVSISAQAAENLVRNEYAIFHLIATKTITVPGK